MATYSTTDFRKNLKIAYNDEPWVILEAQHVKPGKGVAFVKTRMRNLITGRVLEKNFRSGDSVEDPRSEEHTFELQSRGHLVCRLLLEKKKKDKNHNPS